MELIPLLNSIQDIQLQSILIVFRYFVGWLLRPNFTLSPCNPGLGPTLMLLFVYKENLVGSISDFIHALLNFFQRNLGKCAMYDLVALFSNLPLLAFLRPTLAS